MHLASRLLETYPAGGKGAKRRRTWGRFTEMAVLGILANLVHFRDVGRGHIYRGLNGTQRVLSWINVFFGSERCMVGVQLIKGQMDPKP